MVTGFNHFGIACHDTKKSLEFYLNAFEGAKKVYQFGFGDQPFYMVQIAEQTVIELIPGGADYPADEGSGKAHIALHCENIKEVYDKMLAAGASIRTPLGDCELPGDPVVHCKGAFLFGPEGEVFELCEPNDEFPWLRG